MKPVHFLFLMAVFGSGCVHQQYALVSVSRSGPLRTNGTVLVAVPEDGRFEKIVYPGSGRQTALAVSAAFAKHSRRVEMTAQPGGLTEHLEQARHGAVRLSGSRIMAGALTLPKC